MKVAILGFVLATVITVPVLGRQTLIVDLNGGGDFTEIQAGIDAAEDGDTVLVNPGEYVITAPIDFNRLHDPDDPDSSSLKEIAVESEAGPEETIIRWGGPDGFPPERASVVIFENGESHLSTLVGFTLTGGRGTHWGEDRQANGGGGLLCANASSPTVVNCTIDGN